MLILFHDASALERTQGRWRFAQRRSYQALARLSERTNALWLGRSYFPLLLGLLVLALATGRYVIGAAVLIAAAAWFAALCPDFLAMITPLTLALFLVGPNYTDMSVFLPCIPLLCLFLAAVMVHLVIWPVEYRLGSSSRGLALVTLATVLGGCDVLSSGDRSAPLTLYYTLGLGLGMLVLYAAFRSQVTRRRSYDLQERFARIWLTMGVGMAVVVAAICLRHRADFAALGGAVPEFMCRNFCATILLTTLPAAFFLARRSRWYLIPGLGMGAALLFTGSRSALLFGAVLAALGCFYLVRFRVVSRRAMAVVLALACVLMLTIGFKGVETLYQSRIVGGRLISGDETRWRLLARAVTDFLNHPVFGMGLGNSANRRLFSGVPGSMFFYHNMPAQILGSMGILGAAAYSRLIGDRLRLLWQGRRDPFVVMLGISYLGMLLVSMTNPGEFCPFPNSAMMVMLFAMVEDAVGDEAVPVARLFPRRTVWRLAALLGVR